MVRAYVLVEGVDGESTVLRDGDVVPRLLPADATIEYEDRPWVRLIGCADRYARRGMVDGEPMLIGTNAEPGEEEPEEVLDGNSE